MYQSQASVDGNPSPEVNIYILKKSLTKAALEVKILALLEIMTDRHL